jgi:hypothetical protein
LACGQTIQEDGMNTQELVHTAATIASPMLADQYAKGELTADKIAEIIKIAIETSREIETQARRRM